MLISLVAEPLTGLADTAFIARLGPAPLAALGVGTIVLSGIFWIFNFLGIATQTEVARSLGAGDPQAGRRASGLAVALGLGFGVALAAVGIPLAEATASAMGASGEVQHAAALYLRIRWLGAPAVIVTLSAFGALRGLPDMRTPMRIAIAVNVLNIILDAVLIFGLGPLPPLGIAGAAAATVASQWVGALGAVAAVRTRLGSPRGLRGRDAGALLAVGGDLFLRTALLTGFLVLMTRSATRMGPEAGAAHQAVRQAWVFTAFLLDAYAAAAQSLVGYFRGAGRVERMRRVAALACGWSLGTSAALALALWAATDLAARLLVPPAARDLFAAAWWVAALSQPLNALAFATDGIHWGTGDYRFLRNGMGAATAAGAATILVLVGDAPEDLTSLWVVAAGWIAVRAGFGVARVWPGIGASPFREPAS